MAWDLIDLDGPGPKMLFPLAWGHIGWALGWLFFIGGMSEILILAVTLGGLILACIPHVFTELWHDPVRERTMLAVGGLIIWLSLDRWGVLLPLIIMTLLFAVHVRVATALASGPHRWPLARRTRMVPARGTTGVDGPPTNVGLGHPHGA